MITVKKIYNDYIDSRTDTVKSGWHYVIHSDDFDLTLYRPAHTLRSRAAVLDFIKCNFGHEEIKFI